MIQLDDGGRGLFVCDSGRYSRRCSVKTLARRIHVESGDHRGEAASVSISQKNSRIPPRGAICPFAMATEMHYNEPD